MAEKYPIDFVVPWVDDTDPVWRRKKAEYTGAGYTEGNDAARYRDWDTLKYWFRGVEKFAPWVRYVYFVTDDQRPEWLNMDHPKLKWVKHTDFIPNEYLPVFNVNPIELNLHRIEGISENFVYFNDDVFIINHVSPEDFFVDGEPCDSPLLGSLYAEGFFSYMLFNNMQLINRNFSFRESIRKNPEKWIKAQPLSGLVKLLLYGRREFIPNSVNRHIHMSLKKSTYEKVWQKEHEVLDATCRNKLRTRSDVTAYCIRDWQLLSGEFCPRKPIGERFHTADMSGSDGLISYLSGQKGKIACFNDTENEKEFERHKQQLIDAFEKILPEKSTFER